MSVPAEHTDILYDFIGESCEALDQIDVLLNRDGAAVSPESLQHCFKLFHSVKGSAGFLRLDHLYELARAAERFFDLFRLRPAADLCEHASLVNQLCTQTRKALQKIPAGGGDDFFAGSSQALLKQLNTLPEMQQLNADQEMNKEILEAFIWEVDDLLAAAEQEFVLWEYVVGDEQRLTDLYRILHRLTGNFSFYGYADLVTLSEAIESVFDRYLQGEVLQGEYPEEVFLQVIDAMRDAVATLTRSGADKINGLARLLDALQLVMRMPIGEIFIKAGLVESQTVEQALRVQENARAQQEKPRRLGEVLVAMGEVTPDQLAQALTQQESVAEDSLQDAEAGVRTEKKLKIADDVLVRKDVMVDGNRLHQARELVVHLEGLAATGGDALSSELKETLQQLHEVTAALSRIAVRTIVPRLNRLVHDLALRSGKLVKFKVIGEEFELEREVLERLNDPLVHLLRNGIDHGIEPPEQRSALGKEKQGCLTLSVLRRQEEIWASVEDDGAGLDLEKILLRATRYGLVDTDKVKPDSREIASLIFKLGFTTADKVTDSSGRGVGMDAVKKSLKKLGGRVDVFSRPGNGTRVTLRISA